MTQKIAILWLTISSTLLPTFGQSTKQNPQTSQPSQTSENSSRTAQPSKVLQITKIDARKMTLSVKDDLPQGGSSAQTATASGRRRSNRARRSKSGDNGNQVNQYKVYLTTDTVFKEGATIISFSSLKVGDYIRVTGSPKGGDIQATEVARNSK